MYKEGEVLVVTDACEFVGQGRTPGNLVTFIREMYPDGRLICMTRSSSSTDVFWKFKPNWVRKATKLELALR